ncbi:MAG TPA: hypothetical protein PLQ56_18575 [Aggregatilineales bacterium]|nr:hypothetical protein [Aggregatilineales bacterium]
MRRTLISFLFMLVCVSVTAAQDPTDVPFIGPIGFGQTVEDTLTPGAFFDWWQITLRRGDAIRVDMQASGGLEPLLGLLNENQDLVVRGEDGLPDSSVFITYEAPADGLYTIVATRVGNANGQSSGAYSLRLLLLNAAVPTPDDLQDVTFRCPNTAEVEATTVLSLRLREDFYPDLNYRVTVYGVDGFIPVIRVDLPEGDTPISYCNFSNEPLVGDRFTLPGEDEQTVPDTDPLTAAETDIGGVSQIVNLTIASRDGAAGRYMLVLQGLQIDPQRDRDVVEVALGPLVARQGSVTAYMVGAADSRLDPFIATENEAFTCDDAGIRACESVPAATGAGVVQRGVDGSQRILVADRSDAGVILQPGEPVWLPLELRAREDRTRGGYALIIIGELAP